MILDTTSKTVEVILGAAKTTNDCEVNADFADTVSGSTFVPASTPSLTNGLTAVTVVAAPGASTQRHVKGLSVYNADTVNQTVTVRTYDGTNRRRIIAITLTPGSSVYWVEGQGWQVAQAVALIVPTRQTLTTGTAATYTTPAGCKQLRIRMLGGGGGGSTGTAGSNGANGTKSTFNSIDAAPGAGGGTPGIATLGGAGGTGGAGTASVREPGSPGATATFVNAGVSNASGGVGGASTLAGGGNAGYSNTVNGSNAAANTGAGGGGSGSNTSAQSGGAGGGAGEYVEIVINSPAASYVYTIGGGGAAGGATAGTGGSGVIIVDEYY